MRVADLGGAGGGELAGFLAGKPVAYEVRDQEQRLRRLKKRRTLYRQKLVESVYRHELDARYPVYLLFGHPIKGPLLHAFGAGVAVVVGVEDHAAVTVQEGEVYAPGVDPEALNPPAVPCRFGDPVLDLPYDPQHVPVQTIR
jgi:hypothetical protein